MNDPIHETLDVEGGRRRPGETAACIGLAVAVALVVCAGRRALRRSKGRIKHHPPPVVCFKQVDEWIFLFLHVVVLDLAFVVDGIEQAIFVRPRTCRIPFALASPSVAVSAATDGMTTRDASGHMAADAAQNGPGT